MTDFQPGERVRVILDGVFVQVPVDNGYLIVNVGCDEIRFGLDEEGVTVEHVAPPEWPPRPGDLWKDRDGSVWLACSVGDSEVSVITMICAAGAADRSYEQVLTRFSPLTLVHREERS